jgi:ribonuclease BN (tRNA processing enzyme)
MTEVTFLGMGSAIPMRGQTNASYLVRSGATVLLIDCGPAVLQQLAQVDLTPGDITHVFITHRHGDHTLGYPLLQLWWKIQGQGTPPTTITSDITWPSLAALVQHTYGDAVGEVQAPHALLPAAEPGTLRLNDQVTLRTWPLAHSDFAPVLGVRVEIGPTALAFTGDTAACENLLPLAHEADLLVHDATFSATLDPQYAGGAYGHCTAQQAGRHAAAANAKHLILTHIAPEYAGRLDVLIDEASAEFPGLVSVPVAGDVYTY